MATKTVEPLTALDAWQQAAVYATEPRVRCQAGPGAGKTHCLTARVAALIAEGVPPGKICAVTFTKKAAQELEHRLGGVQQGVMVGTWHSLGLRIIRGVFGYRAPVDTGASRRLLRKAVVTTKCKGPFSAVTQAVTRSKMLDRPVGPEFRAVFDTYQRLLGEQRGVDFGDMIQWPVQHFRHHPEAVDKWSRVWSHILVDETQDTSRLQWELLSYLVRKDETSLFIVGDMQQSLYGFRGAFPDLMADKADRLFGPFHDRPLTRNYRSVPSIVDLGNQVMRGQKFGMEMLPNREEGGGTATISFLGPHAGFTEEADSVMQQLIALHEAGVPYGDMAVLYRLNAQSAALETAALDRAVPHVVLGDVGFYARAEVMDCLAYLRVAVSDDGESMDRIYGKPTRYIGAAWLAELYAQGGWGVFLNDFGKLQFSRSHMTTGAQRLWNAVTELRQRVAAGHTPSDVLRYVIDGLGYRAWLLGESPDELDAFKGENLDQLLLASTRWDSASEFLAFARQCTAPRQASDEIDRVRLMTIHRAKGLEFPVVVVAGLREDMMPHRVGDAEEERRILFVAVTRAKDRVLLSGVQPVSRFWTELVGGESAVGAQVTGGGESAAAVPTPKRKRRTARHAQPDVAGGGG